MIDLSKLKALQHAEEMRKQREYQEQSHDQQGYGSGAWHGQLRGIKQ